MCFYSTQLDIEMLDWTVCFLSGHETLLLLLYHLRISWAFSSWLESPVSNYGMLRTSENFMAHYGFRLMRPAISVELVCGGSWEAAKRDQPRRLKLWM